MAGQFEMGDRPSWPGGAIAAPSVEPEVREKKAAEEIENDSPLPLT